VATFLPGQRLVRFGTYIAVCGERESEGSRGHDHPSSSPRRQAYSRPHELLELQKLAQARLLLLDGIVRFLRAAQSEAWVKRGEGMKEDRSDDSGRQGEKTEWTEIASTKSV